MEFSIEKISAQGLGRAGKITTAHGAIETPAFVPVATKGTLKGLTPEQIRETGAQVILGNTYHLHLQPGSEIVRDAGGLHTFMGWDGPLITDSGGFQVFSLGAAYGQGIGKVVGGGDELLLPEARVSAEEMPKLARVDRDGVMFRSHIDGSAHYFTPEKSIEIQHNLGADIIFAFDECTSPNESFQYQHEALERTHRWARQSLEYHTARGNRSRQALFGIVQGGRDERLRKESARVIGEMDFDGFGIGGSFAKEDLHTAVAWVNDILPPEKPRHLLGIGDPLDIFRGVENGVDLFDCVIPTREGRTGALYTEHGRINLGRAEYVRDFSKPDEECACYTCMHYTKAYLAHLFRAKEMLGATLATLHNVHFLVQLMARIRTSLLEGDFEAFRERFEQKFGK